MNCLYTCALSKIFECLGCVLSKTRMKKADIAASYFITTSIQLFQMGI